MIVRRIGAFLTVLACLAGCATDFVMPSAHVTSQRAKVIAPDRARNAVTIGKSTKADVLTALGETLAISFDTGYEIWVYRLPSGPFARRDDAGEFVILFAPSGVVAKTRIRPPAAT